MQIPSRFTIAVRPVLEGRLQQAQAAMEQELASTTLADLLEDIG